MLGKSQVSTETLILMGIIALLVLTIVYYMTKPREDIDLNRAQEALDKLTDYVNRIAEMGVGNKLKLKITIPKKVYAIHYDFGQIKLILDTGEQVSELDRAIKAPLSGYDFLSPSGDVSPGTYDLVVESFPMGVCLYPPAGRDKWCSCFFQDVGYSEVHKPKFVEINGQTIICDINGTNQVNCTTNVTYARNITGLRSRCLNQLNEVMPTNKVRYRVYNWRKEVLFDRFVWKPDKGGYYNLTNIEYTIENSDIINITATCYDPCHIIRPKSLDHINHTNTTAWIPYGKIIAFLINQSSGELFYEDQTNYELIPTASDQEYFKQGRVKSEDFYITITGFKCVLGECINVSAALWHNGSTSPP